VSRMQSTLLRRSWRSASTNLRSGYATAAIAGVAAAAAAAASSSFAEAQAEPTSPPPPSSSSAATPPPLERSPSLLDSITAPFNGVYDIVYENVIAPYAEPSRDKLLPDHNPKDRNKPKPTLVISLDGTLLESQWTRQFGWRYVKRPGVDEFLTALAPLYELVLWTECLSSAETAIDKLDPRRLFRHRLYRDATTYTGGLHRKDLSALNRDLDQVLIIDCDKESFSLQPRNGIAISAYRAADDPLKADKQLTKLIPFLAFFAISKKVNGVGPIADELAALNTPTTLSDNGEAFEKATAERFNELRAKGLMPVQKGGRIFAGKNAKNQGKSDGPTTLWERMGLK